MTFGRRNYGKPDPSRKWKGRILLAVIVATVAWLVVDAARHLL